MVGQLFQMKEWRLRSTGGRFRSRTDSAWKAMARTDQLLTKMFAGRASPELWFDWNDLPPLLDTEARISRLTRWVLLAREQGLHYGLRLPGTLIPMGEGEGQYHQCLKALALYEDKAR